MRAMHVSDSHSRFEPLYGDFEIVVHSGDLCPDAPGNPQNMDEVGLWQLDWLEHNIVLMKHWLKGKPFLYTLGNHDWVNPMAMQKLLNDSGISAVCLHGRIVDYGGLHLYGFPYVPTINGCWNYERAIPEMQIEVNKMVKLINNSDYVDVIVAHAPIHGCLDNCDGINIGNSVMASALDYKIKKEKMPTHYFCGHAHKSNGISIRNGLLVSNAATKNHIIDL